MRLLDLFCGAGGAAVGYYRAGFDEIVGVDIEPQPNYPFEFVQADAMEFPLEGFDLIHASPPCQAFTQMSARWRGYGQKADSHPNLLTPTRERFAGLSTPWVIENVTGARQLMNPTITLHGGMFGLGVHRPRLFETSFFLLTHRAPATKRPIAVYGDHPQQHHAPRYRNNGNYKGKSLIRRARTVEEGLEAMGIDWMKTWQEVKESIPPAYTQFIGEQFLAQQAIA